MADKTVEIRINSTELPEGAKLHGYENYYVQDLIIKKETTCFKRARYLLPDGTSILAPLPSNVKGSFGQSLKTFVTHQYHIAHTSQSKIKDLLEDVGISISEGQIHNIIMEADNLFKNEPEEILKEGLKSEYFGADDTGARHKKMNYYTTVIQNSFFAYFSTNRSKSRKNFLTILQGKKVKYALRNISFSYMRKCISRKDIIDKLLSHEGKEFATLAEWELFLDSLNINNKTTGSGILKYLEEAALLGGVLDADVNLLARLITDNAGQFKNIFILHVLCWIHMIRAIEKIVPICEAEAAEVARALDMVWAYYQKLKLYQEAPDPSRNQELSDEFDKVFQQRVESQKLHDILFTFQKNKDALLCVLKYPETPLHNNSSESDIRSAVIKRKISGPTRSEQGLLARDTGFTIAKTCRKLGISPWEYINDRLSYNPTMIPLATLVAQRVAAATDTSKPQPP